MQILKDRPLLIVLLACLAIFFVNLDAIFINIMEARNFITAREMLDDGNWILTTLNGEPRYQKPPLPTWLTAISAMIFGMKSLIALRLPAVILATLLVLFSYKLSIKLTQNKMFALFGSLIMATSFYIIFSGRNGQWDIFTHGFMMVCIYYLYLFFNSEISTYRNAMLAGLFFGFSFMSKGPVSMYALLFPFLISFGIVYKYRNFRKKIVPLIVFFVIAVIVSGWWHWYTYTYDAEAVAEITRRETANWTGYNVRPFYYYWSFFTQSGIWTLPAFIALLYPYLKNRVFNKKAYLFTLLWTLISVVLLSIIPEKKSRYLLPVLIPMALNTAFYIEYLVRKFSEIKDKRETVPVYFNFGLIALIGLAFPIGGYIFLGDKIAGNWLWYILLSISLFGLGIAIIKNLLRKKMAQVFTATILFIIAIMCFGLPMAKTLTVNPEYKSLALLKEWQNEAQVNVYEYGGFTPELIWAYGEPIEVLKKDERVNIPKESTFGLLISEDHEENFRKTFQDYHIEKITRYDMNPKAPGERSHRPRLWRDFYLLRKK
ncbi:MAG: phospholipid carrier-dependent glycosyltransferase [Flavobacteriaceae bacterium]|nr:phospholipid carrier-dependent glycosyltransferase [Flavobacteriaceae bacterium]